MFSFPTFIYLDLHPCWNCTDIQAHRQIEMSRCLHVYTSAPTLPSAHLVTVTTIGGQIQVWPGSLMSLLAPDLQQPPHPVTSTLLLCYLHLPMLLRFSFPQTHATLSGLPVHVRFPLPRVLPLFAWLNPSFPCRTTVQSGLGAHLGAPHSLWVHDFTARVSCAGEDQCHLSPD